MQEQDKRSSRFYFSANGKGRSRVSFSLKELEPPADPAAERAVIATLFAEPHETYEKLKNSVKAEDFYLEEHKELYEYFIELINEHSIEEIDNFTIEYFFKKKKKKHLHEYLVSILDEATAEKVLDLAIKSVKEKAFLRKAIEREAEILFEIKESEDVSKLKELYKTAIEEIEEIEHVKEEDESLLKQLSLTSEDLEAQQVEYLIDSFIPRCAIVLMTARFGGGKSLSALAIAKYLINQKNTKVLYLDLDNSINTISDRVKKAGLIDELGKRLFYASRSVHTLHHRSELWQRLKTELRKSEHMLIVIDTLKNFSQGAELNSDKEMTEVMSELLDLRDAGHTVFVLHHLAKKTDDSNPYKNNTTIADSVDVAYRLHKDKNKLTFECFKDRIPVRSRTFEIDEQLNLKPALPPGLEAEAVIAEAILRVLPPEGKKQSELIAAVSDYIKAHHEDTPYYKEKIIQILVKHEGRLWEVAKAERNAKIYRRLIDPTQFSENLNLYIVSENKKTLGAQGFEGHQAQDTFRKLNGDNDLSDPEGNKELNNNDSSDSGDDWDDVELDF